MYGHYLRTIEEGMFWRHEHISQKMLLATRKNNVYVGNELNDGTDIGVSSQFRIFAHLLKLVDSKIAWQF